MTNNILAFPNSTNEATAIQADDSQQFTDYTGTANDILPVTSKEVYANGFGKIPGKRALMVGNEGDQHCVNIVSDKYEIHQPVDIYRQFERVSNEFGLTLNKTIFNPKNGGLLISANYKSGKIVGDDHDMNLTFYTSHCGKYKTFLTLDLLRIACMNQVPALYRNKDRHIFSEKHYRNALSIDLLGELLQDLPTAIETHHELMDTLRSKSFSKADFVEFAKDHWNLKKEQKQYQSKMDKIIAAFDHAPGQSHLENSAYKAYNAVTYMNTHAIRNTPMKNETVMIKNSQNSLTAMQELLAA